MTTKVTENLQDPKRFTRFGPIATTSGAAIDVTNIPSWAKRISVDFAGVSTTGTSPGAIVLGDAGGFETSGYVGSVNTTTSAVNTSNLSANFNLGSFSAAATYHGRYVLDLVDPTNNTWTLSGFIAYSNAGQINQVHGSKSLSDPLTQIRITTQGGTDTFDAGLISVLVEG